MFEAAIRVKSGTLKCGCGNAGVENARAITHRKLLKEKTIRYQ